SHQDRQVESNRSRARLARHPQGRRGTAAVLGRERPGSEGNLASNNENTEPTVENTPQEKPAEKTPAAEIEKPAGASSGANEKPAVAPSGGNEKPHTEKPERHRADGKSVESKASANRSVQTAAVQNTAVEAKPV